MTQVRKQAMDSYLKKEKNPNDRLRKQSDDSNSGASRSSIGSEQQDAVDAVIAGKDENDLKDDANSEGSQIARRRSSDLHSAASSNTEQRNVTSSHRISRIPATLDMVLAAAPMVQPMRTDIDLPYMKFAHSAFQSIGNPQESLGKPLDPFRTMYQASHPLVSVEELKFHCMYYQLLILNGPNNVQALGLSVHWQWAGFGYRHCSNPPTLSFQLSVYPQHISMRYTLGRLKVSRLSHFDKK